MARGHLRKRAEGSWTLIVEIERDSSTGKRRQKWTTFHGVKRDAEDELARLLVDAEKGQVGNAGRMTVAEFLKRWLADHSAPNLAPKTHRGYEQIVKSQIKPILGRVVLEKLRPSHVLEFKAALRTLPRTDRHKLIDGAPRTISTRTQRAAYRVLHTALEHAVAWKLIPSNPTDSIPAPAMISSETQPFTAEQAAAFVAASHCQGLAWQAFFLVALNTGMRLAELVGLQWKDVDVEKGAVRVRQTIAYVTGAGSTEKGTKGLVTKAPKTAAGRRSIPIGPDLGAVLRKHKAVQNEQRLQLGSAWKDLGLVFPSTFGTPIGDDMVRKVFARICAVADVPVVRIHDLRHTCATLLLLAGINVKVVSERLGHASVVITMQTYAHVLPGMQEDAAITLERVLRGVPARPATSPMPLLDAAGEGFG